MPINTATLSEAIGMRDWYAVAAVALGALVYAWRRFAPALWARVPDGWRWLPPVLIAGAAGFTEAFQRGLGWRDALGAAVSAGFGIGLTAMGGHSLLKESKLPYGRKPDGSPASRPQPPSEPPRVA
jgi:xanthine/uracil/vitamin C permease (AzgA family)